MAVICRWSHCLKLVPGVPLSCSVRPIVKNVEARNTKLKCVKSYDHTYRDSMYIYKRRVMTINMKIPLV